MLKSAACGFGGLALAGLAAGDASGGTVNPLAPRPPHFPAKAKRVIFLYMQGGVSQVDSFDYKPRLEKEDGKTLAFDDARVLANTGMRGSPQRVMRPLWAFSQHGQCGRWGSTLFPEINRHVDDLCFIHSMQTEGVAHGPATLFLHCGAANAVRPSIGSWVQYGLGTENESLPGFVSIAPSAGNGGPRNYGNAFLPAGYQGTAGGKGGGAASDLIIRNLAGGSGTVGASTAAQRRDFELLQRFNAEQLRQHPRDSEMEAVINSYELAWRMQGRAPDALDLSKESPETLALYGIGTKPT